MGLLRDRASKKGGGKARPGRMAMASAAPKRMAPAKKSAPPRKAAAKKPKKPIAVKKAAPAKKPAPPKKPIAAAPKSGNGAASPRPATPIPAAAASSKPAAPPARPLASAARPAGANSAQTSEERRRAATRKFFARLRSLEAIVGADLRKRGSVVLMQAVDQWYSEAINANATDVTITNAAKAVITHL